MVVEQKTVLGVLGGSGFYQLGKANLLREHQLETPFGSPSDTIVEAQIGGRPVFFLPRHGQGHRLTPSEVSYRANIYALKQLGVTHLIAISAVGIMTEEIRPGDMVLPDQLFDQTKGLRASSFFGQGAVGHLAFADPFCPQMRNFLAQAASQVGSRVHQGGIYLCIEGPRFSTRAESHYYRRTIQPSVIGMTAYPEAALAREAAISYALLGLATDYDCWHSEEDDVSADAVMAVMHANSSTANAIVCDLAQRLPERLPALYAQQAQHMLVTAPSAIPTPCKERLALLYGKDWQ